MIPGYASDHPRNSDQVAIDGPVATLSSVIADRVTQPPLSIGIIGPPGTGKTFFIRRMQERILDLAGAARSSEQAGLNTKYCSRIVQINFRAWHYLGSSVAANLARQVFESLPIARPENGRSEKIMQELEAARLRRSDQTEDTQRFQDFINERVNESRNTNLEAIVRKDFEQLNALAYDPEGIGMERIVLYFDELDYCPPDRVMQVLEGLRLFFSLPLFVTVVAVDLRWLLLSIERQMPIIAPAEREEDPEAATHWSSTPWNYLEEIIQIPYVLPPMERAGYRRLIDNIVVSAMKDVSRVPEAAQYEGDAQPQTNSISVIPEIESASPVLEQEETNFIKALAPLIATPRQAIRMVNLYSVFRASLDRNQMAGLLGAEESQGEYQAVLLLFAVLTSFPILVVPLFKRVHQSDSDTGSWWKLVERLRPESGSDAPSNAVQSMMTPAEAVLWSRLCDQLEEVRNSKEAIGVDQLRPFRKWVIEVARFSIRTAHLVPRTADGGTKSN